MPTNGGNKVIWRKAGMGAVLTASAVALSGCVVFKSAPTAKQKKNSVVITVKGCASQSSGTPSGSCTNDGNAKVDAPGSPAREQVFLGFLVPTSSKAPKSFSASTGPASGGPKLKFTPIKSYASQLQANNPAPSGEHWVGFRTAYLHYSNSSGQQNFTAKVPFGLAKHAKGKFKYEVTIGGRATGNTGANPGQKVNCKGKPTKLQANSGDTMVWICVDDSAHGSLKLH